MSEVGKIHERMSKVLAGCGAIGKTEAGRDLPYKYRSVDAILAHVQPLLAEHHIYLIPEVLESERTSYLTANQKTMFNTVARVRWRFYTVDGSFVEAVTIGEGSDTSDKSSNKAMTASQKYALTQAFSIRTGEEDPDGERPEDAEGGAVGGFSDYAGQPQERRATPPAAPGEDNWKDKKYRRSPDQINVGQANLLMARASNRGEKVGGDPDQIIPAVLQAHGVEHRLDLPWKQMDSVLAAIDSWDPPGASDPDPQPEGGDEIPF